MKLFLMSFTIVLFAFTCVAQEAENTNPQPVSQKLFSEELIERLSDNMHDRYSKKSTQTLYFRKKELEKQLRSQKSSVQTRQRLNLEYSVIQDEIAKREKY